MPVPTHTIALVSDTHGRIHPRLPELLQGVDEIWHLGDVCDEGVLDELRPLSPQLVVVLGNNDHALSYAFTLDLERGGESFHLVHIPPSPGHIAAMPGPGWVLHGHTHRPRDERIGSRRVYNPGSAGLANKGAPLSVAFLKKIGDAPYVPELVLLNG